MDSEKIFELSGKNITSYMSSGSPWFVGKEVAKVLDYKRPNGAIIDLLDNESIIKCEEGVL